MSIFQQLSLQGRPALIDININETLFYQFTISVNKCRDSL